MACRIASFVALLTTCIWFLIASSALAQGAAPTPQDQKPAAECSPKISGAPVLPSIAPGQTVTVQGGDCLPKQGVKVLLRTGKEQQGDKDPSPLDAKVADDGKILSFQIPQTFATGRYLVFVMAD